VALTPAQTWGRELRRVLRRKDVSRTELARMVGTTYDSVSNWIAGRWFPTYRTAQRVAYALESEHLLNLAKRIRTRECEHCGKTFVSTGKGTPARWCSARCRNYRWDVRKHETLAKERHERNGRELAVYRRAVDAFCWRCEPDGLCELRNVSPLRLADERSRVA
jgi:transcriptional regulator with XRE-family HTH domain